MNSVQAPAVSICTVKANKPRCKIVLFLDSVCHHQDYITATSPIVRVLPCTITHLLPPFTEARGIAKASESLTLVLLRATCIITAPDIARTEVVHRCPFREPIKSRTSVLLALTALTHTIHPVTYAGLFTTANICWIAQNRTVPRLILTPFCKPTST